MENIKKAIKHFECMKSEAVAVLDSGFGTKPNESNTVYKNRKLYAELAINALEKQIPKKVIPFKRTAHDFQNDICKHSGYPCEHIKTFNIEYQYTDYKCPVCGKIAADGEPSCCWNCGQALDWGDKE